MLKSFAAFLAIGILLGTSFTIAAAVRVDTRANIGDYLSKGPNDFYPARHDIQGATKFVIDTIGWNATRIDGNLGIGNGDVSLFDVASTRDVEYPENGFMCGDVSVQPWQPGIKNVPENAAGESEESGEGNATGNATNYRSLPGGNVTDTNVSVYTDVSDYLRLQDADHAAGEVNQSVTGTTGRVSPESDNLTYAAYHPIQYLNPVRDVLYEHPLATSGTAYCELLGFETPSGDLVNVGMKCTGYGY